MIASDLRQRLRLGLKKDAMPFLSQGNAFAKDSKEKQCKDDWTFSSHKPKLPVYRLLGVLTYEQE